MIEGCEMTIITLRSARTFKDSEQNETELVLELGLLKDNTEQGCNRRRKKRVSSTTEGAQNKGILALLDAHTEDGANLVEHDLAAF